MVEDLCNAEIGYDLIAVCIGRKQERCTDLLFTRCPVVQDLSISALSHAGGVGLSGTGADHQGITPVN